MTNLLTLGAVASTGVIMSTVGGSLDTELIKLVSGLGVVGVVAWFLFRKDQERSKSDEKARVKAEGELLEVTKEQAKLQAQTVMTLQQVNTSIVAMQQSQNETCVVVRDLVATLKARQCLVDRKEKGEA